MEFHWSEMGSKVHTILQTDTYSDYDWYDSWTLPLCLKDKKRA